MIRFYGNRTGKLATAMESLFSEMSGQAARRRAESEAAMQRLREAAPARGVVALDHPDMRVRANGVCVDCDETVPDWPAGYPAICAGCMAERTR